jgi:membrane protease subunit HflK
MTKTGGLFDRIGLLMAGGKSPWGSGPGGAGSDGEKGDGEGAPPPPRGDGPRNPWLPGGSGTDKPRRSANIEDIFRNRGPEGPRRTGGGGPGFRMPTGGGGQGWVKWAVLGVLALILLSTMIHQVAPREQAIVTTFGKYTSTLDSGIHITLPVPFQSVDKENVSTIRQVNIPDGSAEKLILTGDQNLVDLSYAVRWNIKDLKRFKFQLAEPEETISEVAEAAMRASVAEKTLDETFSGAGRAEIEQRVRSRMQAILDAYRAGINVAGVEIDKTDPPEEVVEAFKDVSAAQQDADADINRAQAFAQQLLAQAQGEAAEFDKVYGEYRLAPEVTRRRLYYETMERVLADTDKTVVETPGVTPYLPLDQLRRRSQQAPAAPQAENGQ